MDTYNSAFAVGWKLRGLTVWSIYGCRLMSTIRQIGLSSVSSPVVKSNQDCKYEPMLIGTPLMQWDEYGYRLYAIEEGSSERILAFSFGKCCLTRGVSGSTYARQVVYGEDRLLVQFEDTDELKLLHINLPVSYIKIGQFYVWQLVRMISPRNKRFSAEACYGWGKSLFSATMLILPTRMNCYFTQDIILIRVHYSDRNHCLQKPMVLDVYQDYLLVTYRPFDVHIFHVKLSGELTPSSTADLQLLTVRKLSIMTAKSHPATMRFIPDQPEREYIPGKNISSSDLLAKEPVRCLISRTNGELSILDLDDGRERELFY